MREPDAPRGPVAVVGAGLTGAGWAALFASHGREVRVFDIDRPRAHEACARALDMGRFLVDRGLADPGEFGRGSSQLQATDSLHEALSGVALVQECVVEDLEVKRRVFAEADNAAPSDAILATSSSGLSVTEIQAGLTGARRCIAAHPYNPPHLVPLVELAPGAETDPAVMEQARRFYLSVGKDPVVLTRDVRGYLANRMSAALWREAIELVRSGVASVADVDRAVSSGPGLRWAAMGPHLVYHLGGGEGGIRGHMEHLGHVKEGMLRDIASWTTFPADTVQVLEEGLREVLGGAELAALEHDRDEALAAFIVARARTGRGPLEPVIAGGASAEVIEIAPGATRATLACGERTTMVRFDLAAGAHIPPHRHIHEQTGYLVSGDLVLIAGGREWPVSAGDSWSIPGEMVHGGHTQGGAVAIEVFAPARAEYLPGPPPSPPHSD